MRRTHLLSLLLFLVVIASTAIFANASFVSKPSTRISKNWESSKLFDFINSSTDNLGAFSGKKMNLWDKVSFKIMKMNMKKELRKNPNMLVSEYYSKAMQKRLAWGWWVLISLGALLLLFIVLALIGLVSEYGWGNIF